MRVALYGDSTSKDLRDLFTRFREAGHVPVFQRVELFNSDDAKLAESTSDRAHFGAAVVQIKCDWATNIQEHFQEAGLPCVLLFEDDADEGLEAILDTPIPLAPAAPKTAVERANEKGSKQGKDGSDLVDMELPDLKSLAKELGLDIKGNPKAETLILRIQEAREAEATKE
ncbi:MAG: SAP domain-containing protein [Deltaproteobacteria bacterium]|nr:SAP domain-containing protein [Deltaproteobacteria bacterium]